MNKLIWLLAVLFIIGVAFASDSLISDSILDNLMAGPTKELFKAYHFVYKKDYDINTELAISKYKNFKANLKFIKEENSKGHSFTLGFGPFTDMSNAEFTKYLSTRKPIIPKEMLKNKNIEFLTPKKYIPGATKINWTKFFGPARNQGSCGSCWAFATAGAIEGNFMKNFSKSINLSPQQIVDCAIGFGCNGGSPASALEYIKTNGIELESAYPYFSGNDPYAGKCRTSADYSNKIVTDYQHCEDCSMDEWMATLALGPVIVFVDVSSAFTQNYKSGIFDPVKCGTPNHAVIAVGIDSDPISGDYLICRNSWSSGWGENGYFRIKVDTAQNTCAITSFALLPKVIDNILPPKPWAPTCPALWSNCYGKGDTITTCTSLNNLSQVKFMDMTGSVYVGDAKKVSLFQQPGCIGDVYTMTTSASCLGRDWPLTRRKFYKRVESVVVEMTLPPQGCVWVYSDCCNLGTKVELCDSSADLNTVHMNNMISAIQFGPGVTHVSLFHATNYQGLSYGWTDSIACINQGDSQLFNLKASSLKINK